LPLTREGTREAKGEEKGLPAATVPILLLIHTVKKERQRDQRKLRDRGKRREPHCHDRSENFHSSRRQRGEGDFIEGKKKKEEKKADKDRSRLNRGVK